MRKAVWCGALIGALLAAAPVSAQKSTQAQSQQQETTGARAADGTLVNAMTLPANAPIGSTPQTVPSTVSPENAALDKLPTMALQFPLTDEQKKLIAESVTQAPKSPSADKLQSVGVLNFVPADVQASVQASEFSAEVKQQIPEAERYRFMKGDKRVLIIDPVNQWVVGEIPL
jgi:hypothetical protein